MKYLQTDEKDKRGSNNNLTKGAFGLIGNNKFRSKLWKKLGIKGVPQTQKGTEKTVYTPYKVNVNKYVPTSKGKVKK